MKTLTVIMGCLLVTASTAAPRPGDGAVQGGQSSVVPRPVPEIIRGSEGDPPPAVTPEAMARAARANELEIRAQNTSDQADRLEVADTFFAILIDHLFTGLSGGILPPPFGEIRKEIRRTVREGLALTPEIQRELWPESAPVALERTHFDWKKDLAAPALGQLPALIFFGIGGRAGGFLMGRAY